MAKATWNGVTIAESDETVVVDGNHYFPSDSLKKEYFEASDYTTVCGWKGTANYYSLVVDGKKNQDAAWYYESPKPEAKVLTGRVAFWKDVVVQE